MREGAEDFTKLTPARNNSPRGIWSDGDVMYVVDAADARIYSYNMPDAADARLASLTLTTSISASSRPAVRSTRASSAVARARP